MSVLFELKRQGTVLDEVNQKVGAVLDRPCADWATSASSSTSGIARLAKGFILRWFQRYLTELSSGRKGEGGRFGRGSAWQAFGDPPNEDAIKEHKLQP